jgi:hypothetical protein
MPTSNQEFSLTVFPLSFHVFKRTSADSQIPLYTVGVWEGTVQRAICHDACLACALAAIRREVETCQQSEKRPQALDPNDSTKPTWYVEYATTVHAVSEEEALHLGEHDVAKGNCVARATRSI